MQSLWKIACAILVIGLATAASAQTFNTLFYFDAVHDGTNGYNPWGLVQGRDGNFYGTTECGGAGKGNVNCVGTVFEISPEGVLTTLYSFCFPNNCGTGADPMAGLILGTDGNFYGTTSSGRFGTLGGEVFRITPAGSLARVAFNGTDGAAPAAPVVQGIDGNLYGTTSGGGPSSYGTVFKASPPGVLTDLYNFCSQPNCADGGQPYAGLMQATDGNFYGTALIGGTGEYCFQGGCGTVFRVTPKGELTTLYNFCSQPNCGDGAEPVAPLMQAIDGYFYGTTFGGGTQNDGTVFRIDSKGALTVLYSFCSQPNCTDGVGPGAGLVQAVDGNFYGTTRGGGNPICPYNGGCGTIFEITPTGTLTTLHTFDGTDGWEPAGGLLQATNGTFYGTTYMCLANCDGTVYSLSTGLGPFVAFVQRAGKVGQTAEILGEGFTGTTNVFFNGISAKFTVQSDTYLTAKVPVGATTGYVTVTESSGVLKSNVPFQVIR